MAATSILYHESRPLKVTISSALIFLAKDNWRINFTFFYLYLLLKLREKCFFFRRRVAWSWRKADSWRRSASSNPGNWLCVLFFPSFFSCLLFSFLLLAFFHDQMHTFKQEEMRKGWEETYRPESSSLHSICGLQINVWFRAFIYSRI